MGKRLTPGLYFVDLVRVRLVGDSGIFRHFVDDQIFLSVHNLPMDYILSFLVPTDRWPKPDRRESRVKEGNVRDD